MDSQSSLRALQIWLRFDLLLPRLIVYYGKNSHMLVVKTETGGLFEAFV
jgi:hypothetical protein